jgi:hypothetical protein
MKKRSDDNNNDENKNNLNADGWSYPTKQEEIVFQTGDELSTGIWLDD